MVYTGTNELPVIAGDKMSFIKIKFAESLENIDTEFQRCVDEMFRLAIARVPLLERKWRPQVDIYEGDDGILVLAEIAGVEKEDLHVEIHSRMLKIYGKRETPNTEHMRFLLAEIPHGYFERRISLPFPVDANSAKATYADGLLKVWMNKLPLERARKIPIKKND